MRFKHRPFLLTRRTRDTWPDPDEWREFAWTLLITCAVCGFVLGVVARLAR